MLFDFKVFYIVKTVRIDFYVNFSVKGQVEKFKLISMFFFNEKL